MIQEVIRSLLKFIMIALVVGHWFGLHELDVRYFWATFVTYIVYIIMDD